MANDWKMAVLDKRGLATLEHLAETAFSEDLKGYLLRMFGEGGERIEQHEYTENEYEKCVRAKGRCFGCGECGAGHPLLASSLLELAAEAIRDINRGCLDPLTGERHEPW